MHSCSTLLRCQRTCTTPRCRSQGPMQQAGLLRPVSATDGGRSAPVADDGPSRRDLLSLAASISFVNGAAMQLAAAGAASAAACDYVATPSGLQFCDVKVGDGPEPVKGSMIRCHYTGRLSSNGRVFDSSYERGRPLVFKVGVHEVITGWDLGILGTEGLPAMKAGGKRELLIPSSLAYGERGAGGVIPPNADLLFTVELLGKPGQR